MGHGPIFLLGRTSKVGFKNLFFRKRGRPPFTNIAFLFCLSTRSPAKKACVCKEGIGARLSLTNGLPVAKPMMEARDGEKLRVVAGDGFASAAADGLLQLYST